MIKVIYSGVMGGRNGFTDAMRRVYDNFEDIPLSNINNGLMGLKQADLVFIQIQGDGLNQETIKHLKNIGAFVIGWSGDIRNRLPECYFNYAKWGIDLTCFSNMTDVEIMRKCGYKSDWLQIGYDPEIYQLQGEVNSLAPIVFMGNSFGHFPLSGLRKDMVRELKRAYGDNFKAFGSGMPDGSFMGNQPGEAAVYRGAKIGINLSHFDSDRYSSDRLFRMLGCSVCVLSHNYKGIGKDFDIGNELIVWNDFNELKERINSLLSHEDGYRQLIAKQGNHKARQNFTFEKMGEQIIELYNKYKNA